MSAALTERPGVGALKFLWRTVGNCWVTPSSVSLEIHLVLSPGTCENTNSGTRPLDIYISGYGNVGESLTCVSCLEIGRTRARLRERGREDPGRT